MLYIKNSRRPPISSSEIFFFMLSSYYKYNKIIKSNFKMKLYMSVKSISDRDISLRDEMELSQYLSSLSLKETNNCVKKPYNSALFERMFGYKTLPPILRFSEPKKYTQLPLTKSKPIEQSKPEPIKQSKQYLKIPEISKILDAPGLVNRYDFNHLSGTDSHLGIVLEDKIYTYDLKTATSQKWNIEGADQITCLHLIHGKEQIVYGTELSRSYSEVRFMDSPTHLKWAIGLSNDTPLSFAQHWNGVLYIGSKKGSIFALDKQFKQCFSLVDAHTAPICKLVAHNNYLATGGNDSLVKVWDLRKFSSPLREFTFGAPVRALDWIDDSRLIAGGMIEDPCIRIYDIERNKLRCKINTTAAVSNLHMSQDSSYTFISTHCRLSLNFSSIKLWKLKGDEPQLIDETDPEKSSIMYSAMAKGGTTLITADSRQENVQIRDEIFAPKSNLSFEEPFTREIR